MLWRSGCQQLCCLQNEETILVEKKALNITILKYGRYFSLLFVYLMHLVWIAKLDANLLGTYLACPPYLGFLISIL